MTESRLPLISGIAHDIGAATFCFAIAAEFRLDGDPMWVFFLILTFLNLINVGRSVMHRSTIFSEMRAKVALALHILVALSVAVILGVFIGSPAATLPIQIAMLAGTTVVIVAHVFMTFFAYRRLD